MKKLLFLSSLALTLCGAAKAQIAPVPTTTYGTTFTQQSVMSPARLPVFMSDKQTQDPFQMAGFISHVSQNDGSWLIMRTDNNSNDDVFVKVKNSAFVLPATIANKKVLVNGKMVKKMMSVQEQQTFLQRKGASAAAIAQVTSPQEGYEMEVTGVTVAN